MCDDTLNILFFFFFFSCYAMTTLYYFVVIQRYIVKLQFEICFFFHSDCCLLEMKKFLYSYFLFLCLSSQGQIGQFLKLNRPSTGHPQQTAVLLQRSFLPSFLFSFLRLFHSLFHNQKSKLTFSKHVIMLL